MKPNQCGSTTLVKKTLFCHLLFLQCSLGVGDDLGKIWIYDVGEQLAIPQPDEWNKFAHTLQVSGQYNMVFSCCPC
jgi:hypothetical protein